LKKNVYTKVLSNIEIAPNIHRIELERRSEFGDIIPGQFVHIKCGEEGGLLLRRPISISYFDDKKIGLVIRNAGKGTAILCSAKVGQTWDVLGPLGNGFTVQNHHKKIMIVGGGIGTAPLLELAKQVQDRDVTVLLGYKNVCFLTEEFMNYAKVVRVATEDGNEGHKGFVTELVIDEIRGQKPDVLYACGPEPMLKGIQSLCRQYDIRSQISVEERMACGVGACLVCACKLAKVEDGYKYSRACKDGPVFSGDEVIFDE